MNMMMIMMIIITFLTIVSLCVQKQPPPHHYPQHTHNPTKLTVTTTNIWKEKTYRIINRGKETNKQKKH